MTPAESMAHKPRILDAVNRSHQIEMGPGYVLLTNKSTLKTKGFDTLRDAYEWIRNGMRP